MLLSKIYVWVAGQAWTSHQVLLISTIHNQKQSKLQIYTFFNLSVSSRSTNINLILILNQKEKKIIYDLSHMNQGKKKKKKTTNKNLKFWQGFESLSSGSHRAQELGEVMYNQSNDLALNSGCHPCNIFCKRIMIKTIFFSQFTKVINYNWSNIIFIWDKSIIFIMH